jgi:putative CocE/NonD family hydrolase
LAKGERSEDSAFWRARGPERVLGQVVRNGVPAYLVGGLDDLFQGGVFRNYVGLQNAWAGRTTTLPMAPRQEVTGNYQALVGPWFHATIGAGGPDLQAIQLRWFDRWLKGVQNGIDRTSTPLQVVGRARETHMYAQWPLPNATTRAYNLAPGRQLSTAAPRSGTAGLLWTPVSLPCQRSSEVWALGLGKVVTSMLGLPEPCGDSALQPALPGPLTQAFNAPPFSKATTVAGPINAEINLRATTRDAELVAKVYDVAPNGRAVEISTGALLASHRAVDPALSWRSSNGLMMYAHHPITHAAARPLVPGQMTTLHVTIPPTVHVFQPGHRLRLVLATAEVPALLPLPADLVNLIGGIYTVRLGGAAPSRLNVPVVN